MGGTMGEMTLTPCSFIALLKVLSLVRVIRTVSIFASARWAARSFLGRMGVLLQRTPRGGISGIGGRCWCAPIVTGLGAASWMGPVG